MQVKNRRTKLMLLLFLIGEKTHPYIVLDTGILPIFNLTYNHKTKGTISGMLKGDLISRSADHHAYRLTEKGYDELCLEFPFFRFVKHEWDGLWRVISYEIPEKKRDMRDRLRRSMKGWGLGPWHRSFWITPHPIIENLRTLVYGREEEKYIHAFESTHIFGKREDLVEKVWSISEIEKKYRGALSQWHELLSSEKKPKEKLTQITDLYIDLIRDDPGLPKSLVTHRWIGFEAFFLFKEIKRILYQSTLLSV
ncbi:MAG TPA: PaaX family transcriptional regulator C-terminal domain-containing protein [Patescibacteria group bacterium]|nr:PaaX family transcriptional regulator C-terminal domain-containing protein [Patescibacteria group bacterium]